MEWQFRADAPLYAQLVEQIKLAIIAGDYVPGCRLPSVRDMAMSAGVNPNTMQRALAELERSGLVYAQRTSGRFVTEDRELVEKARQELAEARIGAFLGEMTRLGYSAGELAEMLVKTEREAKKNADT